jgi:hypothetical protein
MRCAALPAFQAVLNTYQQLHVALLQAVSLALAAVLPCTLALCYTHMLPQLNVCEYVCVLLLPCAPALHHTQITYLRKRNVCDASHMCVCAMALLQAAGLALATTLPCALTLYYTCT